MKQSSKVIFVLVSLIMSVPMQGFGQTMIDKQIYRVNFSNTLHEPLWVSYVLHKGGGDCDRDAYHFKNDETEIDAAKDEDYKKSGYDKGHLANAEDFAYDCTKDELTFRYYNCLPQTPNLNRGIWKTTEEQVREWSQTDSLLVVCGGSFDAKKIGRIAVPLYCWKVVQSASTKKILFCGWFKNSKKATLEEIAIDELERRLKLQIPLRK